MSVTSAHNATVSYEPHYSHIMDRWYTREYLMIYRGPGLVAVAVFGSSFPPLPSVSSSSDTQADRERETTCRPRGGGGEYGQGVKSYDGEKAFFSIKHSMHSGQDIPQEKAVLSRHTFNNFTWEWRRNRFQILPTV
jgi:hypothetical protein